MPDFLELRLDSISVTGAGFIIFLKTDSEGEARVLPIFIGSNEAQAIALALGDEPPARPLTHDLLKAMLESLDAAVTRVDILDLRGGTFYARIAVSRGDLENHEFDARPSDAIALAVRFDAPIFVARAVFDEAAINVVVKTDEDESEGTGEDEDAGAAEGEPDLMPSEENSSAPEDAASDDAPPLDDLMTTAPETFSPPAALTPLEKLQAELTRAVQNERYEEAARIRDVLKKMGGN